MNVLRRFKRMLTRTGAKPVLSSTWRYDPAGVFAAKHHGIPFIDCTPDLPDKPRSDEVEAWLKAHPRVTRHAALDDDDDELDEHPLFQPSAATGFTPEIARRLGDYLMNKTDRDLRRNAIVRLAENAIDALSGIKARPFIGSCRVAEAISRAKSAAAAIGTIHPVDHSPV